MAAQFLTLTGVTKAFRDNLVVKGVDLAFDKGEFVSLLGPSGCGKTTILRMIAGFELPTSGTIVAGGRDITTLPTNQRNIGMVFQAYALFPNMNVADNIAFGLRIKRIPRDQRRARVEEMLGLIGLSGFGARFPFELSGGQQQRVALARALAPSPGMLLLDEPLSALDAKIRVSLREEIRAIQRELGITTIFVTHDQEEALSISDRIVVLSAGNVEQVGNPFEIYNRPATQFVASFVGTVNSLDGVVHSAADRTIGIEGQSITVSALPPGSIDGAPIVVRLRPEVLNLGVRPGADLILDGTVADVSFLGSVIRVRLQLGQNMLSLDTFNDRRTPPPARGEVVRVSVSAADILVLAD